jgi:hypothetical protein
MLSTASAPATANPTTNNKVGGGSGVIAGFKGRKRVQQQMQQASSGRRLSPAAANAGNEVGIGNILSLFCIFFLPFKCHLAIFWTSSF